jgi:hypothetical protein
MDEKKKAKSRPTAYQDAATESLSHAQDNRASELDDADDDGPVKPTSLVGSAVFKVRICPSASLSLTVFLKSFAKLCAMCGPVPSVVRLGRKRFETA